MIPRPVLDWRLERADAMSEQGILSGLTVVEGSAFVAAPLGGMTLGAARRRRDPL